ncbi:MAG: 3-ketoacyl-ACP reductase [Armatimonadetes bacterium]|nr:3-ketoacyl-ACP reductase [Armatimonadota bacterium]
MSGRVALVTGGARGIGLGIARALAADGWDLALVGRRSEAEAQPALDGLSGTGAEVRYFECDLADDDDRRRLVDDLRKCYPSVHLLINNAGIAPSVRADILDACEESFDRLIGTNLRGPYFLTQAVARWMLEAEETGRAIVFITSVSAEAASISRGDYCISKAGLSMAARLWAVRLAPHGVPVYEVRPGVIATDMTAGVRAKYDAMLADGLALQARWGLPDDVGKVVAALARGDLPYSTGAIIPVDGGMMVPRV